eukprot:5221142-Pleurochrysis_carterae.AAC.1
MLGGGWGRQVVRKGWAGRLPRAAACRYMGTAVAAGAALPSAGAAPSAAACICCSMRSCCCTWNMAACCARSERPPMAWRRIGLAAFGGGISGR